MSKPAKLPLTSAQGAAGLARAEDGAATSEAPGRARFSSFSMEELPQMDLKLGQKKILKGERPMDIPAIVTIVTENPPLTQ